MFKPQMRFQKILFIVLVILAACVFFYSIGLTTDLYPLYLSIAYGSVDGAEYFEMIQPYNASLVKFSIVVIVLSLLPFIFSTNTRRKYYIDNLITMIIQGGIYIACSIFLFVNTTKYKKLFFETVDVEKYQKVCEKKKWFYSGSTIWFDLGYVFGALLIVGALLIAFDYLWKYKLVKEENKMLSMEVANNG